MADDRERIEKIAQPMWASAQRLGMQIAEMPLAEREAAFKTCENVLRETLHGGPVTPEQLEGLVKLQMQAIRSMVSNLDLGGSPKGGRA